MDIFVDTHNNHNRQLNFEEECGKEHSILYLLNLLKLVYMLLLKVGFVYFLPSIHLITVYLYIRWFNFFNSVNMCHFFYEVTNYLITLFFSFFSIKSQSNF